MINFKIFWNCTFKQRVGYPMGLLDISANHHSSIPNTTNKPSPQPTGFSLLRMFKQSI